MKAAIDYMNPDLPPGLRVVAMPIVDATPETLGGYGRLVGDPGECRIEIVRWPAQGTRPVDLDTGTEGGTTEGTFISEWQGDILYGRNDAVGGHYILAYGDDPASADTGHGRDPQRILLWHEPVSKPGIPDSATVGISGAAAKRFALEIASAFNLPSFTNG